MLLSSPQPLPLAPPVSLLSLPSLALLLPFFSLSCDGVPGVRRGERERAGAVGNKCLIIRLIIIPGGSEAGQGRKGKKNRLTVTVTLSFPNLRFKTMKHERSTKSHFLCCLLCFVNSKDGKGQKHKHLISSPA